MADTNSSTPLPPEDQTQRWLKYGANVVLTVVVAIVLAIVATVIAQRENRRVDTTSNKEYSLKPQTLHIIEDLKQPITLVSLYTHAETPQPGATDYAGAVADLLDEYKREGRDITTEIIDPVQQPTKVDDLVSTVINKYGGEVQRYRQFVDDAPSKYFAPVRTFAEDESKRLAAVPIDRMKSDDVNQTLGTVADTLAELPSGLKKVGKTIDELQKEKVPDYKGAADDVQSEMSQVADIAGQVVGAFTKLRDDPKYAPLMSPAVKAYITDSIPRYQAIKQLADGADADYKKLGELKLDDVRQKLREKDAILVLGPKDMRSLSFDQVWQPDTDKRAYSNTTDATVKPKFAGEQQITTAILQLTQAKKPKVVFIRPGGAPLTTPGFPPFQQGGPLSTIADRLRDYNFDVLEKDISGQYAMQAQMQGEQVAPEPSDAEIKDAVWVVLSVPTQQQNPEMPPPQIAPKLAEHLKQGGAALCLFLSQADNLSSALEPWGVSVRTDSLIVHQPIKTASASGNFVEEAQKVPYIFVLNKFGDDIITKPLRSLDACLVPMLPVITTPKAGFTSHTLIPIPQTTPVWGEHDVDGALNGNDVTFQPDQGDLPPPLFNGAAVQDDKNGGRLVALGTLQFITNQMLNIRDPDLAQRGIAASRFPANADLFLNSVFWLSHLEPLIAISPSSMEVNRIGDMSDATLRAWRVGALLVGLPGLVIVGGIGMYLMRRD